MTTIRIAGTLSDRPGAVVQELTTVLHRLAGAAPASALTFDLRPCSWFPPILMAPLAALVHHQRLSGRTVDVLLPPSPYLAAVRFPDGIAPHATPEWEKLLAGYDGKSYVPLTHYPTGLDTAEVAHREQLLTALGKLIRRQLNLPANLYSTVQYLIDETTVNIVDHGRTPCGWIVAQYYRQKGFLDLCIVSHGRTLLESYQYALAAGIRPPEQIGDITTHLLAAGRAANGVSTKNQSISRGFGISTSRKMIARGLGGQYLMWSGNAVFSHGSTGYQTNPEPQIIDLGETAHWPGVLTMLRVPLAGKADFQYTDYLE